ncbi:MAG: hypothetical protein ACFB2X_25880 [Rivularia sp. (in: cyanobacteria)]
MSKSLFWKKLEQLDFEAVKNELLFTGFSIQEIEKSIDYYKLFLYIKFINPGIRLVPPPIVDCTWHTHIMVDLCQYVKDSEYLFGYLLNHCSALNCTEDNQETLETAFRKTKAYFKE